MTQSNQPEGYSRNWLDAIKMLDIINPFDRLVGDIKNGPHATIEWDRQVGGITVERILRQYGIALWGRGFTVNCPEHPRGTLFCHVRAGQAYFAHDRLRRAGVPLVSTCARPKAKRASWLDRLSKWLDD